MGDSHLSKVTPFSLPPGCRFYPSDEHLLCYYLTNKNAVALTSSLFNDGSTRGYDLIRELDLYGYDPFEMPDVACFSYGCGGRKRHWYCYTFGVLKESAGRRRGRRTKSGYWRKSGSVRDVVGRGGNVLGTKTNFVFYMENSAMSAVRTDWTMYEYALVDHLKASFVLCRIFVRSHKRNSFSENGLSSCGEEGFSAVRHIGIQHDGLLVNDVVEAKVDDGNSVNGKNEISTIQTRHTVGVDGPVITRPAFVTNLQFPSGHQTNMVTSSMATASVPAEQILSILEEDFIELDDLVD